MPTPKSVVEMLQVLIPLRQSVFIWGPPGAGKSSVIAQVAKALDREMIDLRANLLDPVDVRGLPHIKDGMAHWATPSFFPTEGEGILNLDELNTAPSLTQNAFLQLTIPPYKLGEYTLPPGWTIVAAGNRATDRAHVTRMSSALNDRFHHINFEVSTDDWVEWAYGAKVVPELIGFVRARPNLLHKFDPALNEKTFPTPRGWEVVSNILKTGAIKSLEGTIDDRNIEFDLLSGKVGDGPAFEFLSFLRTFRSMPDINQILKNPDKVEVPDDPDTLYAMCGALAAKASKKTMGAIVTYSLREEMRKEFSVLLIMDSVRKDKSITYTKAFIRWASKNAEVMI